MWCRDWEARTDNIYFLAMKLKSVAFLKENLWVWFRENCLMSFKHYVLCYSLNCKTSSFISTFIILSSVPGSGQLLKQWTAVGIKKGLTSPWELLSAWRLTKERITVLTDLKQCSEHWRHLIHVENRLIENVNTNVLVEKVPSLHS